MTHPYEIARKYKHNYLNYLKSPLKFGCFCVKMTLFAQLCWG